MEDELAIWQADHDQPDPYLLPKSSMTRALLALPTLIFHHFILFYRRQLGDCAPCYG